MQCTISLVVKTHLRFVLGVHKMFAQPGIIMPGNAKLFVKPDLQFHDLVWLLGLDGKLEARTMQTCSNIWLWCEPNLQHLVALRLVGCDCSLPLGWHDVHPFLEPVVFTTMRPSMWSLAFSTSTRRLPLSWCRWSRWLVRR